MAKKLNIYFYKISPIVNNEEKDISNTVLNTAFTFSNDKDYKDVIQSEGLVNLYGNRIKKNHLIFGTFSYTQIEDIPPKHNNKTKEIQELELKEEEGLGYHTSFMFDTLTNIFVHINKRNGVNLGSIKKFVMNNFDVPNFEFLPLINPTTLQEFYNTTKYKSLKFKIADVTSIAGLVGKNTSVGDIIDTADSLKSDYLVYEIRANRNNQLEIGKIRNIVQILFERKEEEIKELIVDAYDDDDARKHFDFISNRMKDYIEVEIKRFGNFKLNEVYDSLEERFNYYSVALRQNYTFKKD